MASQQSREATTTPRFFCTKLFHLKIGSFRGVFGKFLFFLKLGNKLNIVAYCHKTGTCFRNKFIRKVAANL